MMGGTLKGGNLGIVTHGGKKPKFGICWKRRLGTMYEENEICQTRDH